MRLGLPKKKNVLLLIDKPDWAFDNCAKGFVPYLAPEFNIDIQYVSQNPNLGIKKYDLIHVFFYAEDYYKQFNLKGCKIIKEISSHRWEDTPPFGPRTPKDVYSDYLSDADGVICVSERLYFIFNKYSRDTYFVPNGVDFELFKPKHRLSGELRFGWAGNPNDKVKGLNDFILPAIQKRVEILIAQNIKHELMNEFYDKIDILLIGSKNEGEPIPLLESMANGCFPITTDVGISGELIENYKNGIILKRRDKKELINAIDWCNNNIDHVREMQEYNTNEIRKRRDWSICSQYLKMAYNRTLN